MATSAQIRLALGDTNSGATHSVDVRDSAGSKFTASGTSAGTRWLDAAGVERDGEAAWVSGNALSDAHDFDDRVIARLTDTTRIAHLGVKIGATEYGFNFRSSDAGDFAGIDGAGQSPVTPADLYPTVFSNGLTGGWVEDTAGDLQGRNRDHTLDPRLAGTSYLDSGSGTVNFRVDLPAEGGGGIPKGVLGAIADGY
jgi:hypothetical protein